MNKLFIFFLALSTIFFPLQVIFATEPDTINPLHTKAKELLTSGDTLAVFDVFRAIKREMDATSKENYKNEVKALRSTHQIDQLYLENKLQESLILRKISLFAILIVSSLILTIYFIKKRNKKLSIARLNAQKLKEEAELSSQRKTKLLYTISNDMMGLLSEIKKSTTDIQQTDEQTSTSERSERLEDLRNSADRLQNIYNKIFSANLS